MYRIATRSLGVALLLVWSLALVGCDTDEISSIEDIDFQTLFDVEQTEFSLIAGQPNQPAQFELSYQGLQDRPTLTSDASGLNIEVAEETGTAEAGETTWNVTYTGSMDEASIMETMTVSGEGDTGTVSQDIDVQINNPLVIQQDFFTFVAGQSPSPRINVEYEGIEEAPVLTTEAAALDIELIEDEGNPQDGGMRSWSVEYTEEIDGDSVTEMVRLESDGASAAYARDIEVQFNDVISTTTDFSSRFILVEDFETDFEVPEFTTEGGTTADRQTAESAANSIGLNSLEINAAAGDPVTLERRVSAPGLNVMSFLIKPDPNEDIDLTVTLAEEVNGDIVEYDVGLLVEAGAEWVRYEVALDALLADFNPVAERAGGNGPLESVSFTTDSDVTYYLDDVMLGTTDGPQLEINDFEITNGPYGGFSDIELDFVDIVEDNAPGFTARSMSYTEGGNFFGYNFNANGADIFLADAADADLVLRLGQVSEDFGLFAFIEAEGDAGGYGFGGGQTYEIEASDGWQEVRIPVSELGDDPSALLDPGIGNVGFELQREEEDEDTALELLIDDIRLDATGN